MKSNLSFNSLTVFVDSYSQALFDFYNHEHPETLWLNNSYGRPEEMPVDVFFRDEEEMPELELIALKRCFGKILDIGAGVGSHTLNLQRDGLDVSALEISFGACEIMRLRGAKSIINQDVFLFHKQKFDVLLLLMNGIGLCGTLKGLVKFLNHAKTLINPGGGILLDSSDITYLYEDIPFPKDSYYGEVAYQYSYKGVLGKWFNWLYVDLKKLKLIAGEEGWDCEILYEDGYDQYLAKLTLKSNNFAIKTPK